MDRETKREQPGVRGPRPPLGPGSSRGNPTSGEVRPTPRPEPGVRVRVFTPADDGDGFAARVINVEDDRVLLRVPPGTDPHRRVLVTGCPLQLLLGGGDAAHLFHANILSPPEDGIIEVILCGLPLRLQRREYFRLAVRLPIAVRVRSPVLLPIAAPSDREDVVGESAAGNRESDADDEPRSSRTMPDPAGESSPEGESSVALDTAEPVSKIPETRIFRLADLSGGGCLCLDPEELLRPGRVYAAGLDLHDGESALAVSVEVVRQGISLGYPSAGLRFIALAEKHRERIMRTLFCEHRRRVLMGRS